MGSKKNNLRHTRHSNGHNPRRHTSKGAIRRIAKNQRRNRVRLGSPEREFEAVVNFASLMESGIYQNRGTEEQGQGVARDAEAAKSPVAPDAGPAKSPVAQDSDPAKKRESQNAALECCATAASRKVDVPVDQRPAGACGEKKGSPLRSEVNGDVNLPVPTPPNRHHDTMCHSGVGAPESRHCGNSPSQAQANAGSIQTQSASKPSGGITPKAWIPGPNVLTHASRDDADAGPSGETAQNAALECCATAPPPRHHTTTSQRQKPIRAIRVIRGQKTSPPSQNAALECCATAPQKPIREIRVIRGQNPPPPSQNAVTPFHPFTLSRSNPICVICVICGQKKEQKEDNNA